MFPLFAMARLLKSPRGRPRRPHYTSGVVGGALDRPAGGGDLRLCRLCSGERALGQLVPAAHVVEVALEDVYYPVSPRRQRRRVLLDDLQCLISFVGSRVDDGL